MTISGGESVVDETLDTLSEEEILDQLRHYITIKNPAIWNAIIIVILSVAAYTILWQDVKMAGASLAIWGLVAIAIIAAIQSWLFIPLIEKFEREVEEKLRKEVS